MVARNEANLGFAGGNNVGIRLATGDVVVLLNNDTYVTRGWMRRLIRPLIRDRPHGFERSPDQQYRQRTEGSSQVRVLWRRCRMSPQVRDGRLGEIFETDNLAFFCVAIRRAVLDDVGLLDEAFGLGLLRRRRLLPASCTERVEVGDRG